MDPTSSNPSGDGSSRRALLVLGVVFGGFFLLFLAFLAVAFAAIQGGGSATSSRAATGGPKLGVVKLEGTIGDDAKGIQGAREAEQIRDFAEDESIKAIVVRIDSPGGAVAPSQEIWEEIKRARGKKKVVCSQGNVAASGGYYISVACDLIVANPGTITGSIGVISQFMDAKELVALAKVVPTVLKTGAYKDSGSPLREFNEQDREYFTKLLNDIYEQFLAAVAEGRKKPVEEIRALADGRVFTGVQAKALGLVDELGNFRTAIEQTMKLAGLEGEPELVYPEKDSKFRLLEMLQGEARSGGAAFARGAVEGLASSVVPKSGIMLLAPSYVTGRTAE